MIYRTDSAFYVAADSKNSMSDGTFKTICKIHNKQSWYYAIAGHDDQRLYTVAHNCLLKGTSMKDAVQQFVDEMKKQYEGLMQYEKEHLPESYARYCNNKNSLGCVVFFGFDQFERSYMFVVEFDMINDSNQPPKIKYSIDDNQWYITLGYNDHIKYSKDALYKILNSVSSHIEQGVEKLVKIEMKNYPEAIGEPIDLLMLTKKGPKWFRKKSECN